MELHHLAARFGDVAESYERGRPDYAPAVIDRLVAELHLRPGARVLDLAAGTGKLSRALLQGGGLDVVAVEPQDALRAYLAASIGAERVRAGVAEAIPLADGSVDAVTVADAFHWFDQAAALAEIARVLHARGGLAVIMTAGDWSGASWAHEVGTLITELRPEHPHFDGPSWQEALRASERWQEPRVVQMTISQPAERERIVAHVSSISWIAALPAAQRAVTLERVRELIGAGSMPAELKLHVALGLTALRA